MLDLDLQVDVVPSSAGGYRIRRGSAMNVAAVRPETQGSASTGASSTTTEGSGPRRIPLGERRYEGDAEESPLSSGRMLDDGLSFDFDIDADGALELDCLPSSHRSREEAPRQPTHETPPASRRISVTNEASPPTQGRRTASSTTNTAVRTVAAVSSTTTAMAADTHASLLAFAGFGQPPTNLVATASYALRVITRRRALRKDIESARRHRVQEVAMYEAALRTADDGAVRSGIFVIGAVTLLSFLLVIAVVQMLVAVVSVGV